MYHIDFSSPCHVHFIGIGGISMSGLAEILLERGFTVSGSDGKLSNLTETLENHGAKIFCPQDAKNVTDSIDIFVYSAAIHPDNPEYAAAEKTKKPMLSRADLLGQIMENYENSVCVAGTHGKTSTTGMIGQILLENADPTITIGGILPSIKSNIKIGHSDYFLAEACEYTNSFHSFYPKYNVILNVEEDHMDFFKDLDDVRKSFRRFAENTADDGVLVLNADTPDLSYFTDNLSCEIITFGDAPENLSATNADEKKADSAATAPDYYAKDISYNEKGLPSFVPVAFGEELPRMTLHVPGAHNIKNALAAIAVCRAMDISPQTIRAGLDKFGGTERRFEFKGTLPNGAVIIDDYAHHPTEISASMAAAKKYPHKRLVVIFQPHTYTRTKAFLSDFGKALSPADLVILAPIYAAREDDIYGVSSDDVRREVEKNGTKSLYLDSFEKIEKFLEKNSLNGDLLITMGAGDIVTVGEDLLA